MGNSERRRREVAGMISAAEDRFGGLDILVNNAGDTGELGFLDSSAADWESCLRLNLHAPMLTIQAALPRSSAAAADPW